MSFRKKVDIAIVGVQKAATSSLHNYIGQHPQIISHDEREFTFFVQDDEHLKGFEKVYDEYFPTTDSTKKILIKNVGLIFWEDAMQRLQQHNPDVKIILILRNPVERAYSAFWYAKLRGKETKTTFEEALQASEGKIFDKTNKAVDAYLERGNYIGQLKTLYKYFNPQQVKIILFEDLKKSTENILNEVCDFCEISHLDIPDATEKKLKGSSQPRFKWLAYLTNRQHSFKKKFRKLMPKKTRHVLRQKLNNLNKMEFTPPAINKNTKQKLIEHYKPMVKELSELIKRDLSNWNK